MTRQYETKAEMRMSTWGVAVLAGLILIQTAAAQPGGPKKKKGPPPSAQGAARNIDDQEQRALDKLALTGAQKNKAQRALDAHQTAADRQLSRLRQDFIQQMKDILTLDQNRQFRDSLDSGPFGQRAVTMTDLVERVMVFDKDKTGKVRKEDLPERMQHLVALGDTNGDGYLDREELTRLALSKSGGGGGGGGFGGGGRGPGNQVRAFTAADAERAVTKLQLTDTPKTKAQTALDTFRDETRKATTQRRETLLNRMKEVLTEDEFKRFSEALPARAV